MQKIETKDGSVYHVSGLKVRLVKRASSNTSSRLTGEWQDMVKPPTIEVGMPMIMWWGTGADPASATAEQYGKEGPGVTRFRGTRTSPVVLVTELQAD